MSRGGSTRAWRKLRAQVLERDGWTCRVQLLGTCTQLADQAHHVVPVSRGGRDELENLVAACRACNLAVGDRLPGEYANARADRFSPPQDTPAPSVLSFPDTPQTIRKDH